MIEAIFSRVGEQTVSVHVHGHAGYATCGEDIVCAGVSAACDLLRVELVQLCCLQRAEEGPGYVWLVGRGPEGVRLTQGLRLYLEELATRWRGYLRVVERDAAQAFGATGAAEAEPGEL